MTGATPPAGVSDVLARGLAAAARRPLLVLAVLVALQTLPSLGARDLWANDEVRHADALRGVLSGEHALVLHMGGRAYPDKPPGWFWLVAGLQRATGLTVPSAFFLASALGAFAFAAATHALARRVARLDPETALSAATMALATPLSTVLAQTTRMDLAFAAAIVAAETALHAGLSRAAPSRWTVVGAALAVLAAAIKGPLGVVLPLATVLAWLAWTGRLARLGSRDALAGLGVVLGALALYAGLAARAEGPEFLSRLLEQEVWRRAAAAGSHALPVWFYAAVLPALVLPWSLLALALPWRRRGDAWRGARAARRGDAGPVPFLLSAAVSGLVVLSALSGKLFIYLAPVVPPLAALGARAIGTLPPAAVRRALAVMGALGLGLAVLVALGNRLRRWPYDLALSGLVPLAASLAVAAGAFLALRRADPRVTVAVAALALVLSGGVALRLVAPSLDPVMSPRAVAEEVRAYADRGFAPLVLRTYEGILDWHAGRPLPETNDVEDVRRLLAAAPRAVVTMPRKYWDRYGPTLSGLRVVRERWVAGETLQVVAVKGEDPR